MKGLVFLLLATLTGPTPLWALDDEHLSELTVANGLKVDFEHLFILPQDTEVSGPDLLDDDPLEAGKSRLFYLNNTNARDKYTLIAVDADGNRYEAEVTIAAGKPLTYRLGAKHLKGTFVAQFQDVTVTNQTDSIVNYLFFSADESEIWGADLLGEDLQLEVGDSHTFKVPVRPDGAAFNLLGVDENGEEYQLDVTAGDSQEPLKIILDSSHKLSGEEDSGD